MKGNEAIAEAAIRAGCKFYYGYPITPQTELTEYLAKHLPAHGGKFLQAASEISAINRVFGAAAAGARVMTSSSGPGMSLKQEGISYLCAAQLPCVIVDIMRGGPGLGNIQPAQADYFQATKGGGHGDYRTIVLAPSSVQEMADFTILAFDLADQYRIPVLILADGALGQMMEPLEFKDYISPMHPKPWALTGCNGRAPNKILPFNLDPVELEKINLELTKKYEEIERNEVRCELTDMDHPDITVIGYGFVARILKAAAEQASKEGIQLGIVRPITLWPFTQDAIRQAAEKTRSKRILVVEMSMGQMLEDVERCAAGRAEVHFYGRSGGMIPSSQEIVGQVRKLLDQKGEQV